MRSSSAVLACSIALVLVTSCGGSGHESTASTAYLSGTWSIQESATGNCSGISYPQVRSYSALLSQVADALTGSPTTPGPSWQGTVSGTNVFWTASRPDSGGTVAVDFSGTAAADGSSLGGTATWTWTGSAGVCGGTATVTGTRTAVATPFGPPSGVSARVGNGQLTLTWDRVVGAGRYRFYRSTTPDVQPVDANRVGVLQPGMPPYSWSDGWLTNGTPYYYVVTALKSDGTESAPSVVTTATPSSALPRPPAPTLVSANPGSRTVALTASVVAGAESYKFYYSTTNDLTSYAVLQPHLWFSASYPGPQGVGNLTPGTTYWFAVTAWNPDGESEPSAMVSATPMP